MILLMFVNIQYNLQTILVYSQMERTEQKDQFRIGRNFRMVKSEQINTQTFIKPYE